MVGFLLKSHVVAGGINAVSVTLISSIKNIERKTLIELLRRYKLYLIGIKCWIFRS